MARTRLNKNELAEIVFTSAMYERDAKRLAAESKRERFAEEKALRGRQKKVVKQPRRSIMNDEDEAILRELRFI